MEDLKWQNEAYGQCMRCPVTLKTMNINRKRINSHYFKTPLHDCSLFVSLCSNLGCSVGIYCSAELRSDTVSTPRARAQSGPAWSLQALISQLARRDSHLADWQMISFPCGRSRFKSAFFFFFFATTGSLVLDGCFVHLTPSFAASPLQLECLMV